MKRTVVQGDMTANGQRKWEIHVIDDEDVKSKLEKIKEEADKDLHKFCQDRAVELLTGNIILDGEIFRSNDSTIEILKFLLELIKRE